MGKITVEGERYKVVDSGRYNHKIKAYCKWVETPEGKKMVVGSRDNWRFWTARDRTQPLLDGFKKGWPKPGGEND
jgi:hypothetical protein